MTADPATIDRSDPETIVAAILAIFRDRGGDFYGERVTQCQHAVQAAMAVERGAGDPALVVAALLHDLGHLVMDRPKSIPEDDSDDHHEDIGADWLSPYFLPAIIEPLRLHVAAKRYLCAVEPDYFRGLSPVSVRSLRAQGGPMSPEEVDQFKASPYCQDAVMLRRCDEAAKVAGLETPPMERYADLIRAQIL